ncbi:endonuclease/exonuclease/phosphatase family protein [Sulfitobacter donghicola]|uniref:Alpha-1,4 polygalactosaminidase n=1 Tax=Sulfitobacter donghicola DSW-25 = KCTC 12864 = JCM 14565 TaxID=1300350 RepID=A0A073IF30_9RHOB|nr:endonuclease/exonuclease/phosphatase family protein [Sulfitobacter donghicola]KEJ88066.1 alpha-1,4 polygalactosaminidase [Sulfitobacter donghicola DSW-25 = KCTC 12864 = JCM 14565]KIN68715.1 Endonuclease/exonuclease/phosphatase [Sulfitobacter donghicola DSW-25 = KCTC 12864 = JCM 14565]
MTRFTIASFNVKNLIGADKEYYKFQSYTPEEYAWKRDWLADQMVTLDADIVGFQEIFEEESLREMIALADQYGDEHNEFSLPDSSKRYRKRAIFDKLAYGSYRNAEIAFAPNINDGEPGHRRPGLAILSRFGFVGEPEIIQDLGQPLDIPFADGDQDGGFFRISRISRPILKARIPVGDHVVTVFNCHLKSKLGEFLRTEDGGPAPESDLTRYDPVGRALGSARAAMRRMAEAWVLRGAIVQELQAGNPVMVLGDFNDAENAVSSEIISGEHPFKNYQWMLRHDAQHRGDRYSREDAAQITQDIESVRLHAAEKLFTKKSLRDMVFTAAFGGVYESIDQIYMSNHFLPEAQGSIGEMEYFSVLNDHLTDGSHPEAPYNKLASDHGQIMAHFKLSGGE